MRQRCLSPPQCGPHPNAEGYDALHRFGGHVFLFSGVASIESGLVPGSHHVWDHRRGERGIGVRSGWPPSDDGIMHKRSGLNGDESEDVAEFEIQRNRNDVLLEPTHFFYHLRSCSPMGVGIVVAEYTVSCVHGASIGDVGCCVSGDGRHSPGFPHSSPDLFDYRQDLEHGALRGTRFHRYDFLWRASECASADGLWCFPVGISRLQFLHAVPSQTACGHVCR
mmetsp:Transcript_52552/g.139991  ORF Transcript_52552/g.139991 Transcript_52552/m.139991 type:complete len:223 (-) Transcript_52552:448-1116(-)